MNEKFMLEALKQAKKAYNRGEVPVGAVIIKNNKIIAKSYNKIEKKQDSTSHAEINVIKLASKKLKNWRLIECDLYVTLEPCDMCKGAIKNSRIENVYFLVSKKEENIQKTIYKTTENYQTEYLDLLQGFFKEKRG